MTSKQECLPQLFFVRTIPFTGTHFILELIRLADKRELKIGEMNKNKLQDLFDKATRKEIDYHEFITGSLKQCKFRSTLNLFGIFEHLYTPGNTRIELFNESMGTDYKPKTIIPIRDYRQVILTDLMYSCGEEKQEARTRSLNWNRMGFQYIAENMHKENIVIVPIEIWGKYPILQRLCITIEKIYEFLGIKKVNINKFYNYVDAWQPLHMIKDKMHTLKVNDELKLLLDIRKEDKRGIHEQYDLEMEFFENNKLVQELFNRYGYNENVS